MTYYCPDCLTESNEAGICQNCRRAMLVPHKIRRSAKQKFELFLGLFVFGPVAVIIAGFLVRLLWGEGTLAVRNVLRLLGF